MRLLVLGGTSWLGGAVARAALAQGHHVTCLARGVSGPVPHGAHLVPADRWAGDAYDELGGRDWDAVLEVSWQPDLVREAAAALADRVDHWVYVSSISVYAPPPDGPAAGSPRPFGDERDPTLDALRSGSGRGEVPGELYGEAKVACEEALCALVDPSRLLVVRAGLLVGYGDRSDRFGYWPARFAAGAARPEILVPPLTTPFQGLDVAELAPWLVRAARGRVSGTMDAVGPSGTFGDVVAACRGVTPGVPHLHEIGQEVLEEAGVRPWAGPDSLPLWLPRDAWGLVTRSGEAARVAGLGHRTLPETAADALRWEQEQGLDRPRRAGMTAERESELLDRLA